MQSLKTLEQLALQTSDITAITPKVIAKFVEEAARPHLYGRQLLRLNTQLEKTQGTSVHLPLRGTASAYRINELTEPTLSDVSFSTTEVSPFKLGAQLYISQEAIDAGQIDVINGSMTEAGIAIALREDTEVFNELLGKQPDPTASGGIWTWSYETDSFTGDGTTTDYTLSYNPVIQIDSITNGGTSTTSYTSDYYDGKISFTAAPVSGNAVVVNYWHSDRGVYFDANTTGSFKYEDLVNARRQFANNDRAESMVAVLNPDDYTDLLLDSRFIDVSQYGEREPILNGEVGKAAGFKIVETTRIPSGTVLYVNTSRAGWLVQKRSLDARARAANTSAIKG